MTKVRHIYLGYGQSPSFSDHFIYVFSKIDQKRQKVWPIWAISSKSGPKWPRIVKSTSKPSKSWPTVGQEGPFYVDHLGILEKATKVTRIPENPTQSWRKRLDFWNPGLSLTIPERFRNFFSNFYKFINLWRQGGRSPLDIYIYIYM